MAKTIGSLYTAAALALALAGSCTVASAGDSAAATAAANGSACNSARPFYWEIGDESGVIVSGAVGLGAPGRTTVVDLASASKWPLGAYAFERYGGLPPLDVSDALLMLSGFDGFSPLLCPLVARVKNCFNLIGNHTQVPGLIGTFNYDGGNSQYAAADAGLLGLGEYTAAQLTTEIMGTLGSGMIYQYPAVSAGVRASAAQYAAFLQSMMTPPASGGLIMHDYLDPAWTIPTLPCAGGGTGCSVTGTVAFSYGHHYWLENNPTAGELANGTPIGPGDGAFSSPGAYGFYPWISADKTLYGVVSRQALLGTAYQASLACGQAIRYAFTGFTP